MKTVDEGNWKAVSNWEDHSLAVRTTPQLLFSSRFEYSAPTPFSHIVM